MFKFKLLCISFSLIFTATAVLCILLGHPLVFLPVRYDLGSFIEFGILTGVLSFCLVYIALPTLKLIYKIFKLKTPEKPFFALGVLIVLQIVTLLTGYLESNYLSLQAADPFYYYKGIGNSLVYIVTGNVTAIFTALLFAKEEVRIKTESSQILDFESGKNFR